MAKRCTRCGNFLMDDERFCTRCGENVSNIPPEGGVPPVVNAQPAQTDNAFGRNDGYVSPNAQQNTGYSQQPGYSQQQPAYTYSQPAYRSADDEMSLGKWVGTIIVTTFFGIISLIFLFIWGFGDGPDCRKKYCKAMLIVDAISVVLVIIIYAILFSIIASSMNNYIDKYQNIMQEYGQTAAVMLSGIFG